MPSQIQRYIRKDRLYKEGTLAGILRRKGLCDDLPPFILEP
jgi:hypothetical protein